MHQPIADEHNVLANNTRYFERLPSSHKKQIIPNAKTPSPIINPSSILLFNINMKFTTNALAAVAILAGVSVSLSSAQQAPRDRLGRRALSIDGRRALAENMSYVTAATVDGEPEYHHKGSNGGGSKEKSSTSTSTSTSSADDESPTFGARSPTLFGRSGLNVLKGECMYI